MKRLISTIVVVLVLASFAEAQRTASSIKGMLVDTIAGMPIQDATVSLLNPTDSSLVSFTISDSKGFFEINNLDKGEYRLIISHQEYGELKKKLSLAEKQQLDLGRLGLGRDIKTLETIVVSSESPIVVKNDTIQFNASGFKTRPNATAEDLIKKLPGVEVDKEGNIKTQGEQVQKVYVDGKEFFGDDPKLATRNITAEMIESVQVYEDMSEQAKFTKIDDGSRVKTINIKLKKNRKKGYFSRALLGQGDQGRYKRSLSFNKFDGPQRVSAIFNSNNVNESGFSFFEGPGSSGNNGRRSNGGTGIAKSLSAGINYTDEWGARFRIATSYVFSHADNEQEQTLYRQGFFTDSTVFLNGQSVSSHDNKNHRFNIRLEYEMDSLTSILFTSSLSTQNGESRSADSSFSYSEIPAAKYLSITGSKENSATRKGVSWNNNLLFRHRFRKLGRTLTFGWHNTISDNNNNGYNFSQNEFYRQDASVFNSIYQNQQNTQNGNANNNIISTSYTEPLALNKLLEFNYAYTHNLSNSDKKTFDYNTTTGEYDVPDPLLTNRFENLFLAHRFGLNFRVIKKKFNYQFGVAMQRSSLESESRQGFSGKDSLSTQHYTNFFPTANFSFNPTRNKRFHLRYSGRTNQPRISQLQDILDVSDPLHVKTGNPDLRQEFNHSLNLGYNTFSSRNFRYVAANLSFSTTINKIVNSIDTLSSGIQLTRPENVNGFYQVSSYVTVGFPFKQPKLKGSSISFTNNFSYSRNVSLLYKQQNIGQTLSVTQGLTATIHKEKFELGCRASLTYTNLRYSVNKKLNEDFLAETLSVDFSYNFPADFILFTDFDYYVNSGRAEGYNQSIPLWNAAISKLLFEKKNAEIRFSVNDLLNQNQSINRSSGDNFIQDTRSMVLKRYFMISFLFNFNRMGGMQKDSLTYP